MFAQLRNIEIGQSYYDISSVAPTQNARQISCISYACIDQHSPNHGVE